MKFIIIIGLLAIYCSLALVNSTDKQKTLENSENAIKDLIEMESDKDAPESQRKRDSGYYYSRPSRPSRPSGSKVKFGPRLPSQRVKPFNRYGPPNYSSQSHSRPPGQSLFEVPSPIRNIDFIESNPISNQNNIPTRQNLPNYLPPKNQKPPKTSSPIAFQPSRPITFSNNQENNFFPNSFPQRENLIQHPSPESLASDESLFLSQNAQKIAQLYETPATNLNYPPYEDFENSDTNTKNPSNQFRIIVPDPIQTSQQQQQQQHDQQNIQGFNGPIPAYSNGILESPRILERLQSQEKDRIIVQLQQALASQTQDSTSDYLRYAQNYGQTINNENTLLSSIGTQTSQLDKPNEFNNQGHHSVPSFGSESTSSSFGPSSLGATGLTFQGHHLNFPFTHSFSQDTPSITTTTPSSIISSSNNQPHHDNGNNQGNNIPSVSNPFPQYGGFVPTLITGTNYHQNFPNYGTNFVSSNTPNKPGQSTDTLPTHFAIPLPTLLPEFKPINTGSTLSNPNLGKPSFIPPITRPQIPFNNIHPIHPIQPIVPIVSTQNHAHPTYGIQPTTLVNPILVKPVKPVYPLYYYQNIAYPLRKPSLPLSPWNYAPAYPQRKSSKIWK
ncbi:hypothetical protein HCN44_002655 [Aphidius gifuensis]|uniref:Uncharacterized protein n=1 Tax=Aphidius gifuensis TaxID=684658 RepID=A0A834XPL3_APHGI|nr:hypothetical protein HCN44_002655 [Aphidius gifuensis]